VVAHVEELVEREALLADGVEADVDLQPLAVLLQRGESGLPCALMAMMRPATATVVRVPQAPRPALRPTWCARLGW